MNTEETPQRKEASEVTREILNSLLNSIHYLVTMRGSVEHVNIAIRNYESFVSATRNRIEIEPHIK